MNQKLRALILPFLAVLLLVLAGIVLSRFLPGLSTSGPVGVAPTPIPNTKAIFCGCGCCPNTKPEEKCLYRKKGDSLKKIRDQNSRAAVSMDCYSKGCQRGTIYKYCD